MQITSMKHEIIEVECTGCGERKESKVTEKIKDCVCGLGHYRVIKVIRELS